MKYDNEISKAKRASWPKSWKEMTDLLWARMHRFLSKAHAIAIGLIIKADGPMTEDGREALKLLAQTQSEIDNRRKISVTSTFSPLRYFMCWPSTRFPWRVWHHNCPICHSIAHSIRLIKKRPSFRSDSDSQSLKSIWLGLNCDTIAKTQLRRSIWQGVVFMSIQHLVL